LDPGKFWKNQGVKIFYLILASRIEFSDSVSVTGKQFLVLEAG
jgi:hypothetical protein